MLVQTHTMPPTYAVLRDGDTVIHPSAWGLTLGEQTPEASIWDGLAFNDVTDQTVDETYELPWGEQRLVHHEGRQATFAFTGSGRQVNVVVHATNDGVAFRYEIPKWEGKDSIPLYAEVSEFNLNSNPESFWIPGDWDIYEHVINRTPLKKINALSKRHDANLAQTFIPLNAVNTPFTVVASSGTHVSFHEAALRDFPEMTLVVDTLRGTLTSQLVGRGPTTEADYDAGERPGAQIWIPVGFQTPWRTIQLADDAAGLVNSHLILDLNEPNALGDVSWFRPMKYMGIWWEMHLGVASWDRYGSSSDQTPTGRHGATTENAKRYIDFASQHGFGGLLVEGWNTGWEHWIGFDDREGVFDFVTPYPDFDLKEVQRYANERGMTLIMHHETSAAPRTYDLQMDTAYALMKSLGIHSVKTGYVGKIIPGTEFHHGRWMVRHYQRSVDKAAKHHVAVNIHEPIKATGLRRTYPNLISREGARGQEFNAWGANGGNPAHYISRLVYTRMLAGPMDFTPGVVHLSLKPEKPFNQINTTLAQQLAMYVVLYSPIQMACDLPKYYAQRLDALAFIEEVGVDWERSMALDGEVGEFLVVARQERQVQPNGRRNWFVGGVNNESPRSYILKLDFLPDGEVFTARIYQDGPNAHFATNPDLLQVTQRNVRNGDAIELPMAAGGGFAVSLLAN